MEHAYEDVKTQLSHDLFHRLERAVFPETRGHLVNVDLVCEDSPRETRLEMFALGVQGSERSRENFRAGLRNLDRCS